MKNILLLLSISFIITISCNDTANNNSEKETIVTNGSIAGDIEDKVLETIEALPEYKNAASHVNALTNGEQSLSSIIEAPNEDFSDYYIRVGYNKDSWFETYYHFYVNPKTFEVFIEDVIEGDVVSIETWRKREINR